MPVRSYNIWGMDKINKAEQKANKENIGSIRSKYMDEFKDKLTPVQFNVVFEHGTEPPYENRYNGNKGVGLYKSIVSGDVLFSSKDKFDSGSGWPSFTKPTEDAPIKNTVDSSFGMTRTEVSCTTDTIHLGHVFPDGPSKADGGLRYCINSASLKFVSVDDLTAKEKAKYGF